MTNPTTHQQEKAAFFGSYLDQVVYTNDNLILANGYQPLNIHRFNEHDIEIGWLALKPLSQISDEDAIEVSKILQVYPEDVPRWLNGESVHEDFQSAFTFQHAIDYLRSKGYALQWRDKSVEQQIELGWIKLITK